MSCHPRVTAWTTSMQAHLPPLTTPHATVWALGSLGMGRARAWAWTAVRVCLATWRHRKADAVRQPWRAYCDEATATRGTARQALGVATCWVPPLAGGVDQWEGTHGALALDATPLGTRLTVWALSGVARGGAMPAAWTGRAATATPAWRRAWWRMLRQVRRALPRAWTVMGRAERGGAARGRCRRITRWGGHPCGRSNPGGPCRPTGQVRAVPLKT